jgi:hypothetical protein
MWLIARQYGAPEPGWVPQGEELDYFPAPAAEPAYDFKVIVYCATQPARRSRFFSWLLARKEERELSQLSEIIRDTIRQTARKFSIFESGVAERAINESLAKRLNGADGDRAFTLHWTARAEVALPDEVLAVMRGALEEEYEIRVKAKATALRMTQTDELRQGWERFLDDAAKSKNAHHAVELAENPDHIAEVLEQVLNDRRKGAAELVDLIDKIVNVQRSTDILDLVVRTETVLRKTLEMMGIQVPETEKDSLLAPLQGDI